MDESNRDRPIPETVNQDVPVPETAGDGSMRGQTNRKEKKTLTSIKQPIIDTSDSETKVLKSSEPHSYNTLKLPVLSVLREHGERGATVNEVAKALGLPRANIRMAFTRRDATTGKERGYLRWGWVWRFIPPHRDPKVRKRGRPKYVYVITDKGLHELALLERLNALGLPLKPKDYPVPDGGGTLVE